MVSGIASGASVVDEANAAKEYALGQAMVGYNNGMSQWWEEHRLQKDATVSSIGEYSKHSVAVYACVRARASRLSTVPLRLYRLGDNGVKTEVTSGNLFNLLKRVNPYWTRQRLLDGTEQALCYYGESFWVLNKQRRGPPSEIWWAHPESMTVNPSKTRYIENYTFIHNGIRIDFDPDEVIWIPYFNPVNEFKGLSPIRAAQLAIDTSIDAMLANRKFFRNGMHIGGIISPKEGQMPFGKDQAKLLEEDLARRLGGVDRAHRFMILSNAADIKPFGISQRDAEFLDLMKWTLNDVCRVYQVPPTIVQDFERSTYCLPAETRVATANRGSVPIAQVVEGDEVWTVVEGKQVKRRVLSAGKTGHKKLLEITGIGRKIRATDNHPFLVRRMRYDDMPHGTAGGCFRNGRTTRVKFALQWVEAGRIQPGDTIVSAYRVGHDIGCEALPTGRAASKEYLEFLGAYTGDGSIAGSCNIRVAMPETDRCRGYYESLPPKFFVKTAKYLGGHGLNRIELAKQFAPVVTRSETRSFAFSSTLAVREMTALGVRGIAHTKRIPSWIFSLSEDLRLAYLRGVVDSDGYLDFRGHITFALANHELVKDLWHLCLSLGIRVSQIYHRKQSGDGLPNQGRKDWYDLWWFRITDVRASLRIGSNDPLYQNRLAKAHMPNRKQPRISCNLKGSESLLPDGCEYLKIQTINELPAEDVYDITVKDGHCFFADGILVHNSNVEAALKSFWTLGLIPEGMFLASEITEKLLPLFPGEADVCEFDFSGIHELQEDQSEIVDQMAKLQIMGVPLNSLLRLYKPDLIPEGTDGYEWGERPLLMPGQPMPEAVRTILTTPIKPKPDAEVKTATGAFERLESVLKAAINHKSVPEYGSEEHKALMKAHDDRLASWEQRFRDLAVRLFREQETEMLARISRLRSIGTKDIDAENPFDRREAEEAFEAAAEPLFREIMIVLGAAALATLRLEIAFDVTNPFLAQSIRDMAQSFARNVNDTTWNALKESLIEGQANGEDMQGLTTRVQTVMGDRIRSSAENIARTETLRAATAADIAAWTQSGVVTGKMWLTTIDGRERDTHRAVHGQTVPLNANFKVGLGEGPGPGLIDRVEEVVNCRCVSTAIIGDLPKAALQNGRAVVALNGV